MAVTPQTPKCHHNLGCASVVVTFGSLWCHSHELKLDINSFNNDLVYEGHNDLVYEGHLAHWPLPEPMLQAGKRSLQCEWKFGQASGKQAWASGILRDCPVWASAKKCFLAFTCELKPWNNLMCLSHHFGAIKLINWNFTVICGKLEQWPLCGPCLTQSTNCVTWFLWPLRFKPSCRSFRQDQANQLDTGPTMRPCPLIKLMTLALNCVAGIRLIGMAELNGCELIIHDYHCDLCVRLADVPCETKRGMLTWAAKNF